MAAGVATLGEHWTILNDLPLFYRSNLDAAPPDAVPIVHVHGFGISGRYLVPTAVRLVPEHPTLIPDLPGYGRSHSPAKTLTIPQLAETLAAFLAGFPYQRYILLGNSMGCLISLEMAHGFPDLVDRVILVSPAGGPNNQPLYRGLAQMAMDATREKPGLIPVAVPDYVRFGPVNSFRLFRAMTNYPTIERAQELTVPVLAVVGQRDPLVSHERLNQFVEGHPNITLVVQDRAAHAINFTHPEQLSSLVSDWLRHGAVTTPPADPEHTYVAQAGSPES